MLAMLHCTFKCSDCLVSLSSVERIGRVPSAKLEEHIIRPLLGRREGFLSAMTAPRSRLSFTGLGVSSRPSCRMQASMASEHSGDKDVEEPPLPARLCLVGCGGAGMDYLASVASFPNPDDKIRSLELQVQGGGNVGNALTGAARLGLKPRIVTKVADDALGQQILAELENDGVDTKHVVVAKGGVSPFTYIIVDNETKTRTCIHTPGFPPLVAGEVSTDDVDSILTGADFAYFDGRLTDTAIVIAKEAHRRGLPILVDAERKREGLEELLQLADYVVASSKFPEEYRGELSLAEAMVSLASSHPSWRFIIVTLGGQGCAVFERTLPGPEDSREDISPESTLASLWERAEKDKNQGNREPAVFESSAGCVSLPSSTPSPSPSSSSSSPSPPLHGRFLVCTAASLMADEVVDTTGAGDAFIGGVMYGLMAGMKLEKLLPLAATVASKKCRMLGARAGLPRRMDADVAVHL